MRGVNKAPREMHRSAPVYLAAVLEYLTAEVLELAGMSCRDNKKKRITPRHITLAVRNDEEINKFLGLGSVTIPEGGVLSNIHFCLLPLEMRLNSRCRIPEPGDLGWEDYRKERAKINKLRKKRRGPRVPKN